nr:MAG TPA: hypothetical protein [Caudoviricetes sp.]DAU42256.1 MAG TPA: hypothetical protein [Caudoviricetes sp.]
MDGKISTQCPEQPHFGSHQFVQFNRPFFLVDHRFSSFSMGVTVVTLFNIPSL